MPLDTKSTPLVYNITTRYLRGCVYCAVRDETLNAVHVILSFQKINKVILFYISGSNGQKSSFTFLVNLNTLNAELNAICHLLALLGAHHILHVSRIRVNWVKVFCNRDVNRSFYSFISITMCDQ
jgi:hypothetical protein